MLLCCMIKGFNTTHEGSENCERLQSVCRAIPKASRGIAEFVALLLTAVECRCAWSMHSIQAIKALITDVLVFIISLAATDVHLRDLRARRRSSTLIADLQTRGKPAASLTMAGWAHGFVLPNLCCSWSGDHPNDDLARFGYTLAMKVGKKTHILGHPLELIIKIWRFWFFSLRNLANLGPLFSWKILWYVEIIFFRSKFG
jgi:hypothetical protein